jgi:hypothetical protein
VAGPSDAQSGGYHCGHDLLHAIGVAPEDPGWDYSYGESNRDRYGLTDAASAIDFAGASWWHDLTLWLVGRCAAGAPGTEDIREIIYTPDFSVVRRWDRLGIRSSGDSSHLYHTHISFFRDAEGRRNGSFLNLIKSYFGEAPAVASNKKELEGEEYMGQLPKGFATIGNGVPPRQNWDKLACFPVDPGPGYTAFVSVTNDAFGTDGAQVRVAVKTDGGGWASTAVDVNNQRVMVAQFTKPGQIELARAQKDANDTDDDMPIGYGVRYLPA